MELSKLAKTISEAVDGLSVAQVLALGGKVDLSEIRLQDLWEAGLADSGVIPCGDKECDMECGPGAQAKLRTTPSHGANPRGDVSIGEPDHGASLECQLYDMKGEMEELDRERLLMAGERDDARAEVRRLRMATLTPSPGATPCGVEEPELCVSCGTDEVELVQPYRSSPWYCRLCWNSDDPAPPVAEEPATPCGVEGKRECAGCGGDSADWHPKGNLHALSPVYCRECWDMRRPAAADPAPPAEPELSGPLFRQVLACLEGGTKDWETLFGSVCYVHGTPPSALLATMSELVRSGRVAMDGNLYSLPAPPVGEPPPRCERCGKSGALKSAGPEEPWFCRYGCPERPAPPVEPSPGEQP